MPAATMATQRFEPQQSSSSALDAAAPSASTPPPGAAESETQPIEGGTARGRGIGPGGVYCSYFGRRSDGVVGVARANVAADGGWTLMRRSAPDAGMRVGTLWREGLVGGRRAAPTA